eukprot:scaffold3359_cov123-Cylindrotheca_fusiformis.AAC.26
MPVDEKGKLLQGFCTARQAHPSDHAPLDKDGTEARFNDRFVVVPFSPKRIPHSTHHGSKMAPYFKILPLQRNVGAIARSRY